MQQQPILDRWYGAIRRADPGAIAEVTTEDICVFWNGDPARIPWAGEHRGRAAVLEFFASVSTHLEVIRVETREQFAAGPRVVVLGAGEWRVRRTGALIQARMCNIFSFEAERICRYDVFNDSGAFLCGLAGETR